MEIVQYVAAGIVHTEWHNQVPSSWHHRNIRLAYGSDLSPKAKTEILQEIMDNNKAKVPPELSKHTRNIGHETDIMVLGKNEKSDIATLNEGNIRKKKRNMIS